jgi:2-oxoglutarate dehydrogenase E2 component (dihydrolipoamide succinyltransferase)
MSNIVKINNKDQLRTFLKILAEESLTQAKSDVDDERKHQKSVARAVSRDVGAFMREQEVAPGAEPKPEPEMDLGADVPEAEPPPAPAAEKPAAPPPATAIEPSFDALTRAILDLRSGKSVKDSAIETELEAYYDRLTDAERYGLVIFLRSLSDIVTGKVTGATAQDPSDAPHSVTITRPEPEAPAPAAPPEPEATPAPEAPEAEPPPAEEPPAPGPIQVGSPVSEAFRKQIRQLIMANR